MTDRGIGIAGAALILAQEAFQAGLDAAVERKGDNPVTVDRRNLTEAYMRELQAGMRAEGIL